MQIVDELNPEYKINLGGKGATLLRLRRKYSNIPPLFIVCPDSTEDITPNADTILNNFNLLETDLVAVRSSANFEDQANSTFAGLFETRLNVSRESLLEAIKFVYESKNSSRVMEYCNSRNLQFRKIQMSVVVQQQIPSDVSGVCFSRYDFNNELGVIEACWGLGEAIVQGWETPDRYMFERKRTSNLVEVVIGNQLHMIRRDSEVDYERMSLDWNNRTVKMIVPGYKRLRRKLTNSQVLRVADLALKIEKEEGFQVADIEFAFVGDKLFLLQARPGPNSLLASENKSIIAVS